MSKKGITEREVRRVKVAPLEARAGSDLVAVEEPLEIRIAGEPLSVTMRTPGADARLAVGFLFSEGLIRSIADLSTVVHCGRPGEEGYGNVIDVLPAPGVSIEVDERAFARRGTLITAACGVCGRRSIDDLLALAGELPEGPIIDPAVLSASTERLLEVQGDFRRTGGSHAALALDAEGNLLAGFEDVGRHNAVDKVVGALVYEGRVTRETSAPGLRPERSRPVILVVSGRASFEIVQKAAVAQIPIVASVSAASSLAIDLAGRVHLTLATFVRGGGFNLYTQPSRIAGLSG